jgi:hypothetical protein
MHLTVCLVGSVNVCTSAKELGKKGKTEHWATGFDGRRSGNSGQGFGSFNVCWDEMVLSGEGKLEPGVYKFGFELEFCKLAGVSSLPTSLDVCCCFVIAGTNGMLMITAVREGIDFLHRGCDVNKTYLESDYAMLDKDSVYGSDRYREILCPET